MNKSKPDKPAAKPSQHEPQVGDVYLDKDLRFKPRYLRITAVDPKEGKATCANQETGNVTRLAVRTLRTRFTYQGQS